MNLLRWNMRRRLMHGAAGLTLISALAGCNRDETKVYQVPKDDVPPAQPAPDTTTSAAPPPPAAQTEMAAPMDITSPPPLQYQVPEGWQEQPPKDMRVASFAAPGPKGELADVSVIPLPVVGRDLELVNMWRSRVQLPATTDPSAASQYEPVAIGAEQGRLFEFVSAPAAGGTGRQRLVVAMLPRGNMSWFFKITGEDQCVAAQKKHFLDFLKSVSFAENAPPPAADAPAPAPDNAGSIWTVPAGWQSMPPAQFLLAEYAITGANGAKAEVNVAELSDDGGGLLPNVNRWRGQLGLDAIGEIDLPKCAQALDVPGGKAMLVDFSGKDRKTGAPTRLIGAIVSENGQTWFYKLMGDDQVVSQQKSTFTQFIQSANYANAR